MFHAPSFTLYHKAKQHSRFCITDTVGPGVDGRIILKWIFERLNGGGGHRPDQSGSGEGQVEGFCKKNVMNLRVVIKCGEFLE
jgi:hypothetical protein